MSRRNPKTVREEYHRGLTNGNGIPRPDGLTNGHARANGTGRTNGLTNGLTNGVRGRTNGLTNGTGRTNGTGVINGLINGTIRRGLRRNRYGVITQKDLRLGISIVVLFLLLLGPFYLLMSSPPPGSPTRIAVDGNLGDWSPSWFLNDTVASPDNNINLRAYSALAEANGYLSFAIKVQGIALGDPTRLDGFYVFIDKDNSPATGYIAREIGADWMVAVRGGNNAVSSSSLYMWKTTAPRSDWSGWEPVESVRAAVSATNLEVQLVPGAVDVSTSATFLVAANDYDGNETMGSVHFDSSRRALQVEQILTSPIVTASNLPFANLRFTAFGGPVDVTRVSLAKTHGPGTLPDITAFTVTPATPVTRTAAVTYTSADVGEYIAAHVDPAGMQTNVPVTVDGPDLVAYLSNIAGAAPTDHRVEGYFGDWGSLAVDSDNLPQDGNVDIERYGANHTVVISPASSTAFVYADVAGRIFNGAGVVEHIDKPTGGGGGGSGSPPPATPRVGDDVFRAYIDVDTARTSEGTMVLGIRADYEIMITGTYGHVTAKKAYAWSGSAWVLSTRTVNVANDRTQMEASLDLAGVTTGAMAMAVQATDWRLFSDATGAYNFLDGPVSGGTRSDPILSPMHGDNGQTAIAQALTGGPATVDGNCATVSGEYDGAGSLSNVNMSGKVGTNGTYVFVCVDVTIDNTNDVADAGTVYFDQDHNAGAFPSGDDRKFHVVGSTLTSFRGNGATWVPCVAPDCDTTNNTAAGAFQTDHEVYEFKIRAKDVWGSDNPAQGKTSGFAIIAFNASEAKDYTWGSATPPSDLVPDSWGHILAPEFHDLVVPVAVVGVIYFIARRRRRDADS
ncbi:MAG: hypothetical protein E6K16_01755 [Methanobacteriota archaeon]|nr:MAG: hypothetical protein E6K16_01755 [Euryarchaeota archaeon]